MIVFIDGLQLYDSPDLVQKALTTGPALGSALPIVATFDAGIEKELGVVGYRGMKKPDGFTALKNALAKYRGR